jgi:O-antigen/teichoic acid export membrane protein
MRRQLLKDSAVYLSGSLIVQVMGFIGLVLLMRFLPVSEYGKYIYIVEFISIFAFFSDGGFTQHIIKEASQAPNSAHSIYSKAQSAQILISGIMLTLILVIAYPTNSSQDFYFLTIFGSSMVISAFFAPMLAILIAAGRKDLIFYKDVTVSIFRLLYIVFGIIIKAPVGFFICSGFINCIVLLLFFLYIRQRKHFTYLFMGEIDLAGSVPFIREGLVFTILMAANILYNKIDIIMLEKMLGSVEVGYYSGATRFIYPFMFISSAFMTAIFPSLVKHSNDLNKFKSIQYLALYYLGGVGILLSTLLYFGATFIFHTFFDNKFDDSIPVFKVLVWYLAIVFIYGSISNNLVAKNKVKFLVYLNLIMMLVNIFLNFFLIPELGAKGAALATITCELIILISTSLYWRSIIISDRPALEPVS